MATDENFLKTFTLFLINLIQLNSMLDTVSKSMITSINSNNNKYLELLAYKNTLIESSNIANNKLKNLNESYKLEKNKQDDLQKKINQLAFSLI